MAIEYTKEYWTSGNTDTTWNISSFKERKDSVINYFSAQRKLSSGAVDAMSFQSMLEGMKAGKDSTITEIEKSKSDYELMKNGNIVNSEGLQDSAEMAKIYGELDLQTQVEYLQLYYDSYMTGTNSDAQWRLGNVTGTLRTVDLVENAFTNSIQGSLRTRSNLTYAYDWKFLNQNYSEERTQRFYTSLGFPPYKFGSEIELGKKTNRMEKVLLENPNPTFDQDQFLINREDVTFRDVGMKTLSDWINYLQWVAEGSTGIVSTYLTEWDLSVYIQEGLMIPKINGGPMDIYLNYRIRQDNPLADAENQNYTNDKALVFNAVGSAVSKLFFDCTKNWRPSDYPLSAWWMPYLKDRHWTLAGIKLKGPGLQVPYMSFYDDLVVNYAYDSQKDLRTIFQHQDFIGYIARAANTMENPYWSIFYSSESDGTTNMDVKMRNLLNQVAGADYGAASGRDLNYLKTIARKECIMNGGYFGGPVTVDQNGGMFGRTMIDNMMNSEGEDQTEKTEQSLDSQSSQSDEASSETYSVNTTASLAKNSINSNKKDASQMSKLVGINRLSPAIYGGPHGSEYSPYHLRDYYKKDSLVSNQVPKIGFNNLTTENEISKTKSADIEEGKYKFSPTKALSYLKEGSYEYYKKLVYCKKMITKTFEANKVSFNRHTLQFEFKLPETYNGSKIVYNRDKLTFKTKVYNTRKLASQLTGLEWWTFTILSKMTDFGSEVYLKVPVCEGQYLGFEERTVKFYDMQDYPNVRWKITAHKFLDWTTKTGKKEALFNLVNKFKDGAVDKDLQQQGEKTGFVLTCSSAYEEELIKLQLVQYNKGITNSPKYLYFCGCDNVNDRYTKGPSYIFKAPVYLRYYTNVTEYYAKFLFIKTKVKTVYTYMPFLYVDLANTTEYFDMNIENDVISHGSAENLPIHLANINETQRMTASPLQKIKVGLRHTITSFSKKEQTSGLSGLVSMITGKAGSGLNNGVGDIVWTTSSELGIEGVGILSGWQGIDSSCEKLTAMNGSTYDVSNYVNRAQGNIDNIKISQLPMSCVQRANAISWPVLGSPNITVMSTHGFDALQNFTKIQMDNALKNAINKICTSILFKLYGTDKVAKLSIREPVVNFVSYCRSELGYLKMSKDVFNSLNFELIRKVLINNVDACVLKACGLKKIDDEQFVTVKADKKHILYNYWIDMAIRLFYKKSEHETKKEKINECYNKLISYLETTIEMMSDIIVKDPLDWTYNDWKIIMGQIYLQEQNIVKNEIDDFFFAYLNILYCYRLYFIGKRFNKEDGTMWVMRQLESTIDLIHTNEEPAKSPKELNDEEKDIYNVVFYELQNTLDMKREAIMDAEHPPLTVDKVYRIYVKVEYAKEKDWNAWLAYKENINDNPKAREVIRMNVDGEIRYVFKPTDGLYQFKSKEWNDNLKNKEWNYKHQDKPAKYVKDYINCVFPIEWKPVKGKTPIRWNVLGSVNVDNLLEYSQESISAQDLVCLTEEGMDFWTITIPANMWPEASLYKTKLYIKLIKEQIDVYNDVNTIVAGPFANSISPIRVYDSDILARLKSDISFLKM